MISILFVIFHDLQRDWLPPLVVHAFIDLPEGAFAQQIQYFIPEVNLVTLQPVVSSVLFGEVVEGGLLEGAVLTVVVDFGVGDKFLLLVGLEVVGHFEELHGEDLGVGGVGLLDGLVLIVMDAGPVVVMGAICVLPHFGALSLVQLLE